MIGVFDSGLGGLTVLSSFFDQLPQYSYIYLGDNKRAPYGDKRTAEIYNYTKEGIDFLFGQGCTLVIVACNTATAVALRKIQQEHLPRHYSPSLRALGVIRPVVEVIEEQITRERGQTSSTPAQIGIIGTRATIKSRAYETELTKTGLNIKIISQACPKLVPLIEAGAPINDPIAVKTALKEYLGGLDRLDYLILGCTHYSIIEREIKKHLSKTKVLATPLAVTKKLEDYIDRHKEIKLDTRGQKKIYITGNLETTSANLLNYFKNLKGIEIKAISPLG